VFLTHLSQLVALEWYKNLRRCERNCQLSPRSESTPPVSGATTSGPWHTFPLRVLLGDYLGVPAPVGPSRPETVFPFGGAGRLMRLRDPFLGFFVMFVVALFTFYVRSGV